MSYYQENRPAMGGLADALAMQGRRGDSTLVHMNPMEVRMLETMSPDGRLSINPETGLPEAFKLRDAAAFALPIAASIAAPYLLPAIGVTGLSGVAAGAIGAGVGGFGSGLIQGKGAKDSLIQGGLSGLMSYGLGSAFAPATQTAPQVASGVPTATATDPAVVNAALGVGQPASISSTAPPIAPGTPTSGFANIGLGPKDAVQYTAATNVYQPGTSETGLGQMFDRAGRTSPFGSTAFDGSQLGPTQLPTYTQIGGSVLGSAGQMALEGMLSPEEMPYDVADVGMDYPYYDADLAGGRLRGQAAARQLQTPPSFLTSRALYDRATSPEGGGTFFAADGGSVPTPFRFAYGGDIGGEESGYGGDVGLSDAEGTAGSNDSSDDFGASFMGYNPDTTLGQAQAFSLASDVASGLSNIPGASAKFNDNKNAIIMDIPGALTSTIVEPGAYGLFNVPETTAGRAMGLAQLALGPISPVFTAGSMLGKAINSQMNYGDMVNASIAAAQHDATAQAAATGDGDPVRPYDSPYGDPYNTESVQEPVQAPVQAPVPAPGATAFRSLSPTAPRTAGDIYGAATTGGIPRFFTGMAQGGGIASLAYGGDAAPVGFANKAFEGMVPGNGTGMSDDVPFAIEGNQPALLSRDEYVLPADIVSQLGDGSSGAGADMLDNFISQVRQTKYGNTQQPAPVGPQLMTGLMRQGGVV